jgi:transcriptional regulator with XRE-family HTH domain
MLTNTPPQKTNDKIGPRAANAVDAHVGARIRVRRQVLKMSQDNLGEALGVTFQQVQKYERGTNRVGASRVWKLSQVLSVPISFFFEGLEDGLFADDEATPETESVIAFINSSDGVSFAKALARLPLIKRRSLLGMARVMVGEDDGDLLPLS